MNAQPVWSFKLEHCWDALAIHWLFRWESLQLSKVHTPRKLKLPSSGRPNQRDNRWIAHMWSLWWERNLYIVYIDIVNIFNYTQHEAIFRYYYITYCNMMSEGRCPRWRGVAKNTSRPSKEHSPRGHKPLSGGQGSKPHPSIADNLLNI